MDLVLACARAQRFATDCVAATDDTRPGRPSPFAALVALAELGVHPVTATVNIGDTVVDVEEGLNSGVWSVGLSVYCPQVICVEVVSGNDRDNSGRLRDVAKRHAYRLATRPTEFVALPHHCGHLPEPFPRGQAPRLPGGGSQTFM